MKIDFDKNIQDSLREYELPYDANAWVELSKKLDQKMPVAKKPTYKWWILSTIVTAITVGSVYFIQSNEINKSVALNKVNTENNPTISFNNQDNENKTLKISKENSSVKTTQKSIFTSNSKELVNDNEKNKEVTETNVTTPNYLSTVTHVDIKNNKSNDDIKKTNPIVKNDNLLAPSSQSNIDFEIDNEFQYENGIPTIHLKATTLASNYEWNFEKQKHTSTSKETEVHYFKKGIYSVKLSTTNSNGQVISETKKITVNEDYNLLAVDAFSPTENNVKTNTFIPFALTVRNVRFTMTIIDSKNGGIVFQTSDANQPWDGIDKRTGLLVNASESFIWKVSLENPEPGESSIYKGVVIRL